MTSRQIVRPQRRALPPLPTGELVIDAPPAVGPATSLRWPQWLSIVAGLAGMASTALLFGGRGVGHGVADYLIGALFALAALGMIGSAWGGATMPRRADLTRSRRDYLDYLAGNRRGVHAVIEAQRGGLAYRHPHPASLWELARGGRVWERRSTDTDFAVVRIGTGRQPLATALVATDTDASRDRDPVATAAVRRFVDTFSTVDDLPICLAVRQFRYIAISDATPTAPQPARGLARAIVAQLATFHAPADLRIMAVVDDDRRELWEWLKWLPHAWHPSETDDVGPSRLLSSSISTVDAMVADLLNEPSGQHPLIVLLIDRAGTGTATAKGTATADDLAEFRRAHACTDRVVIIDIGPTRQHAADEDTAALAIGSDGTLVCSTMDSVGPAGRADHIGVATVESVARALASLRMVESRTPMGFSAPPGPADREDPPAAEDDSCVDARAGQHAPTAPTALTVDIGTSTDGTPVWLDLKEAAQGGMGPHGLIVGATGSGKSELLRTLVIGLAASHPCEALNVVLIDFKGGATFAGLGRLPHTAGLVTNLANELPLIDRLGDALTGELTRRQELLRRAGDLSSVREYDRIRASGGAGTGHLAAIPALLIVCDEFTELLIAKPDLIDVFSHIGRLGRSLGVHLLLATQRLEEGRLRGLDANLSYRIALRTFNAGESRTVLGIADAASLPAAPGHGFLKVGAEVPRRFTVRYLSGPYREPVAARRHTHRVRPYPSRPVSAATPTPPDQTRPESVPASTPTTMDVLIDRISRQPGQAHRVWLPPLAESPTIDELLGDLRVIPGRGLTTQDTSPHARSRVPVAIVDNPARQCRDVHWLDLAGTAGHVAVVGNPQTGKSTVLSTLVLALALTHTPAEAQFYVLDFGGGSLAALRDLPHVGDIATRVDTTVVRRCVGDLVAVMDERERHLRERGITSMREWRRSSPHPDPNARHATADIFLIVDGWNTIRTDFDGLEAQLADIATRGLNFGIHVIATAVRWHDLRGIRDLFGSRLELRLGDPADSIIDRRAAANVNRTQPGHGLNRDRLHLLTALPMTAEYPTTTLVERIAAAWTGDRAPAVRLLPAVLAHHELPAGIGLAVPLGVAHNDLLPVWHDFAADGHLVIFGDSECGKTSLLRTLAHSITRQLSPDQARLIVVDYRHELAESVSDAHLIGHAADPRAAAAYLESAAGYLRRRLPGADVTAAQRRERRWWSGPECFVLIDDYELVAGSAGGAASGAANPVTALLDYLAHARDVGLHVILARRASGASRAMFDPVLQRLRERGTPTLVMAGDPAEGPLAGAVRPGPLPPGRAHLVTRKTTALVQLGYLTDKA